MSAFIVEDKVINGVIAFLTQVNDARHIIKEETGADVATPEGRQQLGQAMFELNCNAVEQRYPDKAETEFLTYVYRAPRPPSPVQSYKSLRCWLYQCNEGNVPETSLLYATMERVSAELAHYIVGNLPEYEKARW